MAALLDVYGLPLFHHRPAVAALGSLGGKGAQHIQLGKYAAVGLDNRNLLLNLGNQFPINTRFNSVDAVLGRENLLLIFLEFLGYISFRVNQRLLADPLRRHLVFIGIADLDIVSKYVIVCNFQGRYPRALRLPLLHFKEVVLSSAGDVAQAVQIGINPGADDGALPNLGGRLRGQGVADIGQQLLAALEPAQKLIQGSRCSLQPAPYGTGELQRAAKLHHLPRQRLPVGNAPKDALHIAHLAKVRAGLVQSFSIVHQELDNVVPGIQLLKVDYRQRQPVSEHTRAHRGRCLVDCLYQRHALRSAGGRENLQVPQRELVHPHVLGLVQPADGRYVLESRMASLLQVHHQSSGRAHSQRAALYAVTFE